MDADLDILATALYVRTDDLLKSFSERAQWRPAASISPGPGDANWLTLTVLQALLGFVSSRWLRFAGHLDLERNGGHTRRVIARIL